MAGWMTMVVWTVGIVSSLTFLATLTRWTMDYRSRESQSRAKQNSEVLATMKEMVSQSAAVVKIQTDLTEALLLGRAHPETVQLQEPESPSVTLPTQDELFQDLPPNIREAMMRDIEEEATWPSPSVKQPHWSAEDRETFATLDQEMRQTFDPFASTSPIPDRADHPSSNGA